jgi:hypothetical protein
MTLLVTLVVIIALLLILGIDFGIVAAGILVLATTVLGLMTVFFILCTVALIMSKPCTGKLSEIRKIGRNRFDSAVYSVDGEEVPNIFPCEVVLRKHIYRQDRQVKLRLVKRRNVVFDTDAAVCTVTGIILGCASLVTVGNITLDIIRELRI